MKEKKSEAPRRGNEELFKWDGNPTFGQILPLAALQMQRIMQVEM